MKKYKGSDIMVRNSSTRTHTLTRRGMVIAASILALGLAQPAVSGGEPDMQRYDSPYQNAPAPDYNYNAPASAPFTPAPVAPSNQQQQPAMPLTLGERDAHLALGGDRYSHRCSPTPVLTRQAYPGSTRIPATNKLARPAGKALYADGQRLYLQGRLFDAACVPLRDATIEIWHNDHQGRLLFVDAGDLANPYPVFTGGGQAKTDGRGEYMFETIFPHPTIAGTSPFVNARITHPSLMRPLYTTIYFSGDQRNSGDRRYTGLPAEVKDRVTAKTVPFSAPDMPQGLMAHHDMVVNARDGFRSF